MLKIQSLLFTFSQYTEFRFPDIKPNACDYPLVPVNDGISKTALLNLIADLLRPNSGGAELIFRNN